MSANTILVLDFGGQYSHLIARRIRELKVYSEVGPGDLSSREFEELKEDLNIKGVILSGGPSSVYNEKSPKIDRKILKHSIPFLGLCYGHQLIAFISGGKVKPGKKHEYGISKVRINNSQGILEGLDKVEKVWMSHIDTVTELPEDYDVLAQSENCPVAAFMHKHKPFYGIQWHPEVTHTKNGMLILRNFVYNICRCKPNWKLENHINNSIEEIKKTIGKSKAIIALSGGLDSSTATILASKAIGKNLTAVFVNHGFLRKGEPDFVESIFKKSDMNFVKLSEQERFLKKIKGVKEPEKKRKIIGREFIRVFEKNAKKIDAEYLIQGTIYPDRIESGFKKFSDKIKTHHNVGGIPSKISFKGIVEPLRDLYKDEVKKLAASLGLPEKIAWRQPFPGPGLAVRIIGKVSKKKLEIIKKADKIVTEEIEQRGFNDKLWQYFAVLMDTKSTGVKGDARAYGYTVAVRIVESKDAMTANFTKIPYNILESISTRITNEIQDVTRVVYDITNKPPSTIEWE
ncbi:MAG: glutamine-hydrolyzing GMP synthase [Candidatus Bathyarchaeota archaeon]|nr:glutamine-hydrolyzing GMP synthase [Candidatus Bathyarchaeota archaeon]